MQRVRLFQIMRMTLTLWLGKTFLRIRMLSRTKRNTTVIFHKTVEYLLPTHRTETIDPLTTPTIPHQLFRPYPPIKNTSNSIQEWISVCR